VGGFSCILIKIGLLLAGLEFVQNTPDIRFDVLLTAGRVLKCVLLTNLRH
jgi:hypothetical protein